MSVEAPEMPADLLDSAPSPEQTPKPKGKGGRPKKNPLSDTKTQETPHSENGTATSTEAPVSSKKAEFLKHWKLLQVGDWVRWYEGGDTGLEAYSAQITAKFKEGHALGLTIWPPESRNVHRTITGVRHVDDPGYVKFQREEIGAWEPTLLMKFLMDMHDG